MAVVNPDFELAIIMMCAVLGLSRRALAMQMGVGESTVKMIMTERQKNTRTSWLVGEKIRLAAMEHLSDEQLAQCKLNR